ncbi:hypothetical protein JCM1840_003630 [Sporobolomyces johnsonii]
MVKPMNEQSPAVKLLTILNVQSAKPPKPTNKRSASSSAASRDWHALARKAQKTAKGDSATSKLGTKLVRAAQLLEQEHDQDQDKDQQQHQEQEQEQPQDEDDQDDSEEAEQDVYARHWGPETKLVQGKDKDDTDNLKWKKSKTVLKQLGDMQLFQADGVDVDETKQDGLDLYAAKLKDKLKSTSSRNTIPPSQEAWLRTLSSYRDVLFPKVTLDAHDDIRTAAAMHAMNHVLKTRTRILKNNEHLSRISSSKTPSLASSTPARSTLDQGFTRPKVLVLAPFRNSALAWMQHLLNFSLATNIENYPRFVSEYSLPEGATDKLVENREQYPEDHVETFRGNIDDSFRVGLKVTRKAAKVFAEFYQADVIVASPLGLRTSIEKEDDSDFLSSIEILIVDQMDVMLMQNWEHVQFVMDRLNKLPEEAHGCDFSRVKPWYLDGKAPYLRQSLLLSSHLTPEIQSLFASSLHNLGGKLKASLSYDGVLDRVPRGVRQVWSRFDAGEVWEEDDRRFEWFTTKTLPTLLKSAISSSQTIIFVPSYFDFVRLKRYLSKLDNFSFASISEYTPTPDVSRARGAFFSGKKKFLLVSERFHFFRRYRLRGAKTFVFYSPPDHPAYYSEFLSFPFSAPSSTSAPSPSSAAVDVDVDVDVDESELSAHVVFSKYDLMRVERIVGTRDARRMVGLGLGTDAAAAAGGAGVGAGGRGEGRFTFV